MLVKIFKLINVTVVAKVSVSAGFTLIFLKKQNSFLTLK